LFKYSDLAFRFDLEIYMEEAESMPPTQPSVNAGAAVSLTIEGITEPTVLRYETLKRRL